MVAECPVCTGGIGTQRAESMFYVALTPSVVKHLLLIPGDAGGGDRAHQPVETQVLLAAEFEMTGVKDGPITGFEYPD